MILTSLQTINRINGELWRVQRKGESYKFVVQRATIHQHPFDFHVYVVIHFCESVWSVLVQANLCKAFQFVLSFNLPIGENQDPINKFYTATFVRDFLNNQCHLPSWSSCVQ